MSTAVSAVPRVGLRPVVVTVGLLILAGYLATLAVGRLVESSGALGLPGPQDLYLFLGLPVIGLLGWAGLGGRRVIDDDAVLRWSARWSTVWAAGTGACLLFTTARASGVRVWDLPKTADNLVRVMAADDTVVAQSAVLWVALLVAFFASSFRSSAEIVALLLLSVVAVLGAVPTGFAAPQHGGHTFHPLVVAAAVTQLVALAAWLGGAVALLVHRWLLAAAPHRLLRRYAVAATSALAVMAAGGLVGRAAELSSWDQIWTTSPGWAILAQAALSAVVIYVGWRHRLRMADALDTGISSAPSAITPIGTDQPVWRTMLLLTAADLALGLTVLGISVFRVVGAG